MLVEAGGLAYKNEMSTQLIRRVAKGLGANQVRKQIGKAGKFWKDLRYDLDWKYFDNPQSAKLFQANPPRLSAVQQRVVADMQKNGIAFVPFQELFGGNASGPWSTLSGMYRDFCASQELRDGIADYHKNFESAAWKEYIVRYFPDNNPRLTPEHPLLQIGLMPELLDTVNSYLGLWSKLKGTNIWYTIPLDSGRPRIASQKWHRDPEDRKLVKVFLYFTDVTKEAGPLEYIPGSRAGGPLEHLWPQTTGSGGYGYPPQEPIEALPPQDRVVGTCPAATLVFCDTAGLHRGGFSLGKERVLAQWIYLTPASSYGPWLQIEDPSALNQLSGAARYALQF